LDSNEFLFKSLWHYTAETFLASHSVQRLAKNPLFEAISLRGATGPHFHLSKNPKNGKVKEQQQTLESGIISSLSTAAK
jgi:hypothetical protein